MMKSSETVIGTKEIARKEYNENAVFDLMTACRQGRLDVSVAEVCRLVGIDIQEFFRAYGALLAKGRIEPPKVSA